MAKSILGDDFIPRLDIIHANNRADSLLYIGKKVNVLQRAKIHHFKAPITQKSIEATILELSNQPASHGIIIQSPIEAPDVIPLPLLASKVAIEKDVDGLHPGNFALISNRILAPRFYPCTPLGIVQLLRHYGLSDLSGARACVIGRSEIVGLPMAAILTRMHATVTLCHSATKDIHQITRQSDIVVVAVGQANFIQKDWIRPKSIVIDVGINRWIDPWGKTKIIGDVASEVAQVASAITPVPGGVGPMTVAMLVSNVFDAAISQQHHEELLTGLTI